MDREFNIRSGRVLCVQPLKRFFHRRDVLRKISNRQSFELLTIGHRRALEAAGEGTEGVEQRGGLAVLDVEPPSFKSAEIDIVRPASRSRLRSGLSLSRLLSWRPRRERQNDSDNYQYSCSERSHKEPPDRK